MRESRIKLTGYDDPARIDDFFASCLVDVAYVDEVTPEGIFVIGDVGTDFDDPADFEWITTVIKSVLDGYGVEGIEFSLAQAE